MKRAHFSGVSVAPYSTTARVTSLIDEQSRDLTYRLRSAQTNSIGLRSGDCGGDFIWTLNETCQLSCVKKAICSDIPIKRFAHRKIYRSRGPCGWANCP